MVVSNNITSEMLCNYSISDFLVLTNCKRKTAVELVNFGKAVKWLSMFDIPYDQPIEKFFDYHDLSVRARRALYAINIKDIPTLFECVSGKSIHLNGLPNVGKKTIAELHNFFDTISKDIESRDIPNLQDTSAASDTYLPSLSEVYAEFNFPVNIQKILYNISIIDSCSLIRLSKLHNSDLTFIPGIGNQKNLCLQSLLTCVFNKYFSVSAFPTTNEMLKNYFNFQSKLLDDTLSEIFVETLKTLSSNKKQNVQLVYHSFFDVIATDLNSDNTARLSSKRNRNVLSDLVAFRDAFNTKADMFCNMSEHDIILYNLFAKMPYLSNVDKHFISEFLQKEDRLPIFFLLLKSMLSGENRWAFIFLKWIGIIRGPMGEKLTLSQIADADCYYSIERVRVILKTFMHESAVHYVSRLPFVNRNSWNAYPFLNLEIISKEDLCFEKLAVQEQLPYDFSAFCYMCSFTRKDLWVLKFIKRRDGSFGYPYEGVEETVLYPQSYTYVCKNTLQCFNFVFCINYLMDKLTKPTMYDEVIRLEQLCQDSRFWCENQVKNDLIPFVENLLLKIICDTLQIILIDGCIYIKANKVNIKQFIYDYMVEKGYPVSVNELLEALLTKHPDSECTDSNHIRAFLYDKTLFKPMGRKSLYTLANSNEFCGNLSDLVCTVLSSADFPMTRDEVFESAHKLRSDYPRRSILTTISALLRSKVLLSYTGDRIGLTSKTYPNTEELKIDDIGNAPKTNTQENREI